MSPLPAAAVVLASDVTRVDRGLGGEPVIEVNRGVPGKVRIFFGDGRALVVEPTARVVMRLRPHTPAPPPHRWLPR